MLTGVATFLILMLQRRGQKPLEKVIGGLLLFVAVAYVVELIFSQPALAPDKGLVIPTLPNGEAVFLAAGVLGRPLCRTLSTYIPRLPSICTAVRGKNAITRPAGMWRSP